MNSEYNSYLSKDKHILMHRGQISFNVTKLDRGVEGIKYIVIHGTGNNAVTADDYMHYKYFNSGNKSSSADFFVDHDSITKLNDYYKNFTWHVGDYAARGLSKPKIPCYNSNSVGIEICVNFQKEPVIMDRTIKNAIELVKELKKYLRKDIKVVRHFDVTGKYCPADILVDKSPNVNANWVKFLQEVQ